MTVRLRFWLWMLDVMHVGFGFGSRPYYWALRHASDAIDWGPAPEPTAHGKEPF